MLIVVPGTLAFTLQDQYGSLGAAVTTSFATYWALLTLFVTVYRLSPFHPLARYPGPLLCKLSKGWLAYLASSSGKTYSSINQLHQLYGDVVRIGES